MIIMQNKGMRQRFYQLMVKNTYTLTQVYPGLMLIWENIKKFKASIIVFIMVNHDNHIEVPCASITVSHCNQNAFFL